MTKKFLFYVISDISFFTLVINLEKKLCFKSKFFNIFCCNCIIAKMWDRLKHLADLLVIGQFHISASLLKTKQKF